ncbi:hypothetical protein [Arthrobacter sp. D3-16]
MSEAINEGLRTDRERRQRIAEDRPQLRHILRARQRQGSDAPFDPALWTSPA